MHKNKIINSFILFLVFAVAAFIILARYMYPPSIVPSSSTAGVGLIFVFPVALICGIIGSFIGKYIISKFKIGLFTLIFLTTILTILLVFIINFMHTLNPTYRAAEKANTFGFKTDRGMVKKVDLKNTKFLTHENLLDCNSLYLESFSNEENELDWSGNKVIFSIKDGGAGYAIYNTSNQKIIENTMNYYPYITSVSLYPYEKNKESYLFVLANLRASSDRSLLTVYKYPGEIIFEELLERQRPLHLFLGFGKSTSGEEIITILDYLGDYPDDYNLCKLNKKFEEKDFEKLDYGYQVN